MVSFKMTGGDFPDLQREFDEHIQAKFTEIETAVTQALPELQGRIHKDTGALASSARVSSHRSASELNVELAVGDNDGIIIYALFENARKNHDIFGPIDYRLTEEVSAILGGRPTSDKGSVHHNAKREAT